MPWDGCGSTGLPQDVVFAPWDAVTHAKAWRITHSFEHARREIARKWIWIKTFSY
jgi:hypothetical protein